MGGMIPELSMSQQAAQSADAILAQHEEAKRSGRALLPMPNGTYGFLDDDEEMLQHEYLSGKHMAQISNARDLLKDPKPDCLYVWAARLNPKGDRVNSQTIAHIRSSRYRPVSTDEIKDETDVPIEKFKVGEYSVAGVVDVVLMEVGPKAARDLYKWRTLEAKRRTNRWAAFENLKDKVKQVSHGMATAELDRKE